MITRKDNFNLTTSFVSFEQESYLYLLYVILPIYDIYFQS